MRCSREGCGNEFEPWPGKKYCSTKCRVTVAQRTYAERGLRAAKDARWYARDGWYRQSTAALRRRIAQRLEEVG